MQFHTENYRIKGTDLDRPSTNLIITITETVTATEEGSIAVDGRQFGNDVEMLSPPHRHLLDGRVRGVRQLLDEVAALCNTCGAGGREGETSNAMISLAEREDQHDAATLSHLQKGMIKTYPRKGGCRLKE